MQVDQPRQQGRITQVDDRRAARNATVDGKPLTLQSHVVRMLDPLDALSDVYYDEEYLEGLRQLEPMKPQAILEFDDAD